jgi:hypothetical protein
MAPVDTRLVASTTEVRDRTVRLMSGILWPRLKRILSANFWIRPLMQPLRERYTVGKIAGRSKLVTAQVKRRLMNHRAHFLLRSGVKTAGLTIGKSATEFLRRISTSSGRAL